VNRLSLEVPGERCLNFAHSWVFSMEVKYYARIGGGGGAGEGGDAEDDASGSSGVGKRNKEVCMNDGGRKPVWTQSRGPTSVPASVSNSHFVSGNQYRIRTSILNGTACLEFAFSNCDLYLSRDTASSSERP